MTLCDSKYIIHIQLEFNNLQIRINIHINKNIYLTISNMLDPAKY